MNLPSAKTFPISFCTAMRKCARICPHKRPKNMQTQYALKRCCNTYRTSTPNRFRSQNCKRRRLSERECLRCFHRMIGDTPIQYLLKYRLMQSAAMLHAAPTACIAEISAACGFDNPSYFSKQFRRFYQCTPREYRNAACESGMQAKTEGS